VPIVNRIADFSKDMQGWRRHLHANPEPGFECHETAGFVIADQAAEMGAEDFSYILGHRPGAYLFLGQGDGPGVHHPADNFNDEISPIGASFFARLVERKQPLRGA
jgi:metal-dependent amidase/aminoacylase/carboxypeptidase family protein